MRTVGEWMTVAHNNGRRGTRFESAPGTPGNPPNAPGAAAAGVRTTDDARPDDSARANGGADSGADRGVALSGSNGGGNGRDTGRAGTGGRAGWGRGNGWAGTGTRIDGVRYSSPQVFAARRQEAANRKRELALAAEKAAEDKRAAKKLRSDAELVTRARRIAAVGARERVVPLAKAIRATFRNHSDGEAPLPRARSVADPDAASALRAQYDATVAKPVRNSVLGVALPAHLI